MSDDKAMQPFYESLAAALKYQLEGGEVDAAATQAKLEEEAKAVEEATLLR